MTARTGVVDAHHHVWDLSVRDQDWITGPELAPLRRNFTVEDLEPQARAVGVSRTVLVQTVTVAEETPEFLALAETHDLIGGVVGWTDLTGPDVADELARLRELPGGRYLKGIRHQVQGEPDPEWLLRPDVRRGLARSPTAGLVYDLVVPPAPASGLRQGGRSATPGLTFVLDHLGKPPIAAGELGAVGHRRPRARRPAEHRLQALRNGDGGGPDAAAVGAGAATGAGALRGHRAGRLRPGPAHVRLRLAGVHAGASYGEVSTWPTV